MYKNPDEQSSQEQTGKTENAPPHSTVLVVDDEKNIRIGLKEFLLADGYAVRTAADATEGLRILGEMACDVVVSDILLPGINGIKLLEAIRNASPHVQVIMITGAPTVDNAAAALRAGAFDYLTKPVNKDAVLRVVGNAARIKHMDDERRRLLEANDAYRCKLEGMVTSLKHEMERRAQAEGIKDDFLNMVSHDLRTPLAISKEALGLLTDDGAESLSENQKHILEIVSRNMNRLASLVDDLLDVSLLDAGKLTLENAPFDLVALTQQLCTSLGDMAAKKGLSLDFKSSRNAIEVTADHDRMLQILTNLGTNAIKYTQTGSVSFTIRDDDHAVVIEVEDTGVGISSAELSSLFEKFQKTTATRKTGQKGIGLGLFITRNLVELHGGTIDVSSQEGKGSVFSVRLPAQAKR